MGHRIRIFQPQIGKEIRIRQPGPEKHYSYFEKVCRGNCPAVQLVLNWTKSGHFR